MADPDRAEPAMRWLSFALIVITLVLVVVEAAVTATRI